MKLKLARQKYNSIIGRDLTYQHYLSKYYNLYMNRYTFEGLDYQQVDFLLRKLWATGHIAGFKLKNSETDLTPQGLLVLTDFAPTGFNIYDFPVAVSLINTRGVKFIPSKPQQVDKDVVIGFAQRNKKSVLTMVDYYVNKIVNTEMVIDINLKVQKTPWVCAVTPESKTRVEEFMSQIEEDNPSIFMGVEDINNITALTSGSSYVIDKLYNYKCALENELREYLGLKNLGVGEKKEHLISNEIEANNEATEASGDCFLDCLSEFFERVYNLFGIKVSVKINEVESQEDIDMEEDEDVTK